MIQNRLQNLYDTKDGWRLLCMIQTNTYLYVTNEVVLRDVIIHNLQDLVYETSMRDTAVTVGRVITTNLRFWTVFGIRVANWTRKIQAPRPCTLSNNVLKTCAFVTVGCVFTTNDFTDQRSFFRTFDCIMQKTRFGIWNVNARYGCDSWTCCHDQLEVLNSFQHQSRELDS